MQLALGAVYAPESLRFQSGVPFKTAVYWSVTTGNVVSGVKKLKVRLQRYCTSRGVARVKATIVSL